MAATEKFSLAFEQAAHVIERFQKKSAKGQIVMKHQHGESVDRVAELEQNIAEMKSKYEEEKEFFQGSLDSFAKAALHNADKKFIADQKVKTLQKQHRDEIEKIQRDNKLKEAERIDEKQRKMEEMKEEYSVEIAALKAKCDQIKNNCELKLQKLKDAHEMSENETRGKFECAIIDLKAANERKEDEIKEKVEIKERHERLLTEFKEEKEKMIAHNNREKAELKKEYLFRQDQMKGHMELKYKQLQNSYEDQQILLEDFVYLYNNTGGSYFAKQHHDEIEKTQCGNELKPAEEIKENSKFIENMEEEYSLSIATLEAECIQVKNSYELKLQKFKDAHEMLENEAREKFECAIIDFKATDEKKKEEMKEKIRDSEKQLRDKQVAVMAQLKEEYERVNTLLVEEKGQLVVYLEAEISEKAEMKICHEHLVTEFKKEKEQIIANNNREKAELKKEHLVQQDQMKEHLELKYKKMKDSYEDQQTLLEDFVYLYNNTGGSYLVNASEHRSLGVGF